MDDLLPCDHCSVEHGKLVAVDACPECGLTFMQWSREDRYWDEKVYVEAKVLPPHLEVETWDVESYSNKVPYPEPEVNMKLVIFFTVVLVLLLFVGSAIIHGILFGPR